MKSGLLLGVMVGKIQSTKQFTIPEKWSALGKGRFGSRGNILWVFQRVPWLWQNTNEISSLLLVDVRIICHGCLRVRRPATYVLFGNPQTSRYATPPFADLLLSSNRLGLVLMWGERIVLMPAAEGRWRECLKTILVVHSGWWNLRMKRKCFVNIIQL